MNSEFSVGDLEVVRVSDNKYSKITVEITFLGEPFARIDQEDGLENLKIEIFTDLLKKDFVAVFPLSDFLKALEIAKFRILG